MTGHSWAVVLDGTLIAVIAAIIIWAARRIESLRPPNGERKAESERLRQEICLALAQSGELLDVRLRLAELSRCSTESKDEINSLHGAIRKLHSRLDELEQSA